MYWTCSCHHWHGQSSSPHGCVLTTSKHCLMLGVPFQQQRIWPAESKPTTQSLKGPRTARAQAATHTPACCTCRSFCRQYPRPPLPARRACRGSWRQPWSAEAGAEEPQGSRCWCAGRTSPCCSGSLPRPGPQWRRRTCRAHTATGLLHSHWVTCRAHTATGLLHSHWVTCRAHTATGLLHSHWVTCRAHTATGLLHSHWVTCRAHTATGLPAGHTQPLGYLQGTRSHWVTCRAHTATGLPAQHMQLLGYLHSTHSHWVTCRAHTATGLLAGHTQPLGYLHWVTCRAHPTTGLPGLGYLQGIHSHWFTCSDHQQ